MPHAPLYRKMHYLDNSYKEIHMKKIIALGLVLFTSVAFAVIDSGNGSGSGSNDGKADVAGNGSTNTNVQGQGSDQPVYIQRTN